MHYFLGLYEKGMPRLLTLREKLTETKSAGYDFIEHSIDETEEKISRLAWSNQEIRELHCLQNLAFELSRQPGTMYAINPRAK